MARSLWKIKSSFYHLLRRNPLSIFILHRENEGIRYLLKELNPKSVLDIGCGRGNGLTLLLNFTAFVAAVDQVSAMVHKSKMRYPMIKFITADAQFPPFRESSFDLISGIGLFEYVKNWPDLLREIYRVLSPDGYAIITLSPPGLLTYLRLFLGHRLYTGTEEDFRKILNTSAPFSILQYNRTLLQHQFLLKKGKVIPATGMPQKNMR
jgi:ubiquinone/menaquinone biosynthesis C-methylase UbiE